MRVPVASFAGLLASSGGGGATSPSQHVGIEDALAKVMAAAAEHIQQKAGFDPPVPGSAPQGTKPGPSPLQPVATLGLVKPGGAAQGGIPAGVHFAHHHLDRQSQQGIQLSCRQVIRAATDP